MRGSSMLPMSRKRLALSIASSFFVLMILLALGLGVFLVTPKEKTGEEKVFVVRTGLSLKEITSELQQRQLIKNETLFMLWARLMGYSRQIKAGEYALSPTMSPVEILEKLRRGIIMTHPVTIPEGFNMEQIAVLLEGKGLVEKEAFLGLAREPATVSRLGLSGPSLEGYLYPDTYHFGRDVSTISILETMVNRFWEVVGPYTASLEKTGLEMEEVVILASIVEKETGLAKERPAIASVFLNRLKRGMRLASDPTVIYGLDGFDGNLTKDDLSKKTPYNTYVIRGLPPGPIANPGLESIKAVIFPDETDYLYFVSKNDGSHYFSKTLSEHNRAVETYQKKKRKELPKTS
jgi:UPF0755 protein